VSVLRATVCEGIVLEILDSAELLALASTTDYRDQRAFMVLDQAQLVVDYELDNALEHAPHKRPPLPDARRRYAIRCVATETALVFPVVNLLTGTGAGFGVFPYSAIKRLCG
jgi:hypothetical protein